MKELLVWTAAFLAVVAVAPAAHADGCIHPPFFNAGHRINAPPADGDLCLSPLDPGVQAVDSDFDNFGDQCDLDFNQTF